MSGFSKEERAAMRERARELKGTNDESAVLERIAEMPDEDRAIAERIHEIVKAAASDVAPRTWYGMPAYAIDGNVICFFQSAHKFKARYATLGFSDKANLDDGSVWPTSYAVTKLGRAQESTIKALVKQAFATKGAR